MRFLCEWLDKKIIKKILYKPIFCLHYKAVITRFRIFRSIRIYEPYFIGLGVNEDRTRGETLWPALYRQLTMAHISKNLEHFKSFLEEDKNNKLPNYFASIPKKEFGMKYRIDSFKWTSELEKYIDM